MKADEPNVRSLVLESLLSPGFVRATFGGPVRGSAPSATVRVVIRPVEIRGERCLQFSAFDARQDHTDNVPMDGVPERVDTVLDFANIHLTTTTEEVDIRTSKKGKIFVGRRRVATPSPQPEHNRSKDVPLPEGESNRLLEVLGIATPDGRIRATMRAKYAQINEFLKQLTHVLDVDGLAALGRELQILDCGCGSSYLTFAAHHYLNHRGIPARILGVDVNDDLIRKSLERSARLNTEGLDFATGRIEAADVKPDLVLALHACDTATDDAIATAIRSEAKVLLSVPCCHHYLNERLRAEEESSVLRPMLRHGILHQRTADLVTDSFRALVLRILGYRTDVVEFISTEHTARNLMIRAVRGLPVGEAAFVREYREMRRFWGVVPYLETLLGEEFLLGQTQ